MGNYGGSNTPDAAASNDPVRLGVAGREQLEDSTREECDVWDVAVRVHGPKANGDDVSIRNHQGIVSVAGGKAAQSVQRCARHRSIPSVRHYRRQHTLNAACRHNTDLGRCIS